MAIREHLRELRNRLIVAAAFIALGAVAGWILYPSVFDLLVGPLRTVEGGGVSVNLNFTAVMDAFDMKIRVSIFLGLFLASPFWLYQLWAFVTPGLTKRERWTGIAFVATGVPLFLAGAYVAWLVLPQAVELLLSATPDGVENLITATTYLTFVMQLMLIFGVAFLLPLVMVALSAVGVVRGSTWRRGWRWAIILIFVFAAVATPSPDVLSMIVLAIPMCGLYGGALLICAWFDRRRDRRRAAIEAGIDPDGDAAVDPSADPA